MNLRVLQVAEQEAQEAAIWYEQNQAGLGTAFLDEYASSLERIESNSFGNGRLETIPDRQEIRRLQLQRFPYLIIYEILSEEVMVLALAHVSRSPNYWIDRDRSQESEDTEN